MKQRSFRPLIGTAAVLATTASLYFGKAVAASPEAMAWLGSPADGGRVDRVITIDPSTRWVNVHANEVVRFVVHESSGHDENFTWQFNGARSAFHLADIAPAGVISEPIGVYVASDPMEGTFGSE
jgi:hypothetical protein